MASDLNEKKRSHGETLHGMESDALEPESKKPRLVNTIIETVNQPTLKPGVEDAAPQSASSTVAPAFIKDAFGVPGLLYYPNFVSDADEVALIEAIDAGNWDTSLKRRVQHFGLRYDYTSKKIDRNTQLEPLPDFMLPVVNNLTTPGAFDKTPDQCIVNEYTPGQGINAHIDRVESFGPVVASLSLGSTTIMNFQYGTRSVDVLLEKRSMVILTGDARFKWKHSIAARTKDQWHGEVLKRGRRVSMTFRTLKLDQ